MRKLLPTSTGSTQLTTSSLSVNKGFTLVELLVVVTIIAILSVIGIAIYTGVQKTARDARRVGDVDAITGALEANYNSGSGTYSTLAGANFSSGSVPIDPLDTSTGGYQYNARSDDDASGASPSDNTITGAGTAVTMVTNAKYFYICAKMEDATKGNASGISGAAGAGFYCKKNQQ